VSIKDNLADEFERGKPWNPRKNPDDPNPLYAAAVKWSRGTTAHGEADFLSVRDDDETLWSILVGTYRLQKDLLEGEISEWDENRNAYAVIDIVGPVQPGELLAIEYKGEREFTNKEGRKVTSPNYRTLRKTASTKLNAPDAEEFGNGEDIPY
jgi:hypothetical protein